MARNWYATEARACGACPAAPAILASSRPRFCPPGHAHLCVAPSSCSQPRPSHDFNYSDLAIVHSCQRPNVMVLQVECRAASSWQGSSTRAPPQPRRTGLPRKKSAPYEPQCKSINIGPVPGRPAGYPRRTCVDNKPLGARTRPWQARCINISASWQPISAAWPPILKHRTRASRPPKPPSGRRWSE